MGCSQFVAPYNHVALGGDYGVGVGVTLGERAEVWLAGIVAQEHAFYVYRLVAGVVKLHPVVLLAVFIYIDVVGGTYLVDSYRSISLRDGVVHRLVTCNEVKVFIWHCYSWIGVNVVCVAACVEEAF